MKVQTLLESLFDGYCDCGSMRILASEHDEGCGYRLMVEHAAAPTLSEMLAELQHVAIVPNLNGGWKAIGLEDKGEGADPEAAIRALYAKERDGGDSLPEAVHEPPPPAPPPGEETWGEEILPPRGLRKLRRRLSDRLRALYAKRADA